MCSAGRRRERDSPLRERSRFTHISDMPASTCRWSTPRSATARWSTTRLGSRRRCHNRESERRGSPLRMPPPIGRQLAEVQPLQDGARARPLPPPAAGGTRGRGPPGGSDLMPRAMRTVPMEVLPGSTARLGRPALDSEYSATHIAEFDPAGHINGFVAEKQRNSIIDAVFHDLTPSVDESDLRDAFTVDPATHTEKPRPTPTTEVGPWATSLVLPASSAASSASGVPRPISLLERTKYVAPGTGLGVFELDGYHRPAALDPLLQDADGVRPSLEWMSASVDRGTGRGPWGCNARRPGQGDARRPRDVCDDRLSRRIHLRDSHDLEDDHLTGFLTVDLIRVAARRANPSFRRQAGPPILGRDIPLQYELRDVTHPEADPVCSINWAIDLLAAYQNRSTHLGLRHPEDLRVRPAVFVMGLAVRLAVPQSAFLHLAHQRIDRPTPDSGSTAELCRQAMRDLLRADGARCRGRQPRKVQRVKRDELCETDSVNLPGVAAGRGDVRTRWPHSPTRRNGREGGMGFEQVQFGRQLKPVDSLDGRALPPVVERIKKELPAAIDATAADPDWTRVAGVGGPSNLVRMLGVTADDLAIEHIDRTASHRHPEVGTNLAQLRQGTRLSGLRPGELQRHRAERREGTSGSARIGCRPSSARAWNGEAAGGESQAKKQSDTGPAGHSVIHTPPASFRLPLAPEGVRE